MTIKKALEHFEWKLSNKWQPTEKDIEAYNEIVEFTEAKLKQQYTTITNYSQSCILASTVN